MVKKMKVGVLYGGVSKEREVSINTGKEISKNLDRDKYEVHEIILDKKEDVFKCKGFDFIFNALHGEFGEDGEVQAILDAMNIKYNGCGFKSSAICMDKHLVKEILKDKGIPMAKSLLIDKNYPLEDINLNYPIVVKPNSGGSSVGVMICKDKEELKDYLTLVFKDNEYILLEEYIKGTEITVGILADKALPILKIVPKGHEFFNYESKYDGMTLEEPIKLKEDLDKYIKDLSLLAFKTLSCKVYGRVDFILKENTPYFLEINTLPGMTKESLIPKAAREVNIGFKELLDKIINISIN